jgi:hypothetical protein
MMSDEKSLSQHSIFSSASSVISSISSSSQILCAPGDGYLKEYFVFSAGASQTRSGKCKLCSKAIIIKDKSSGNWINHLRSKHKDHYAEYRRKQTIKKVEALQDNQRALSSQTILNFPVVDKDSKQLFLDSLALFMATTGLPHLMIQNQMFKDMLQQYAACTKSMDDFSTNSVIPSQRNTIRKRIMTLGNEVFESIIESLSNKPQVFTTLAADGWTPHKYGAKNTNIIAIAQQQAFLLWSDKNDDTDDSADDYLVPLLTSKIKYLIEKGVAVVAVVTDCASNMRRSGTELYNNPLFGRVVLRIGCSAHVVQLMINNILDLEPCAGIFRDCMKLLELCKGQDSKKLRQEIISMQKRDCKDTPKKIMFYNHTRWWSKTKSIGRLLQLKKYLQLLPSNDQIAAGLKRKLALFSQSLFWTRLEEFMKLAECFQQATNLIQSNDATFLSLIDALSGIESFIRNWDLNNKLLMNNEELCTRFRILSMDIIQNRIKSFVASTEHHAVHALQLLTLDHKAIREWPVNDVNAAEEWLQGWGADLILLYPTHFPKVKQAARSELMATIRNQFACFQGSQQYFVNSLSNQAGLRRILSKNSFSYNANKPEQTETDWKLYWSMYLNTVPELASIALCLLSIGISEAMCERSFSIQQLTHTKVRNRLNEDIVEAEMRLRFNKDLLGNEFHELLNPEASTDEDNDESRKRQKTTSSNSNSISSNDLDEDM